MVTKEVFSCQVGNNLRQIRNEKNISIEELANLSEMTYSQVSRIELGKINTSCYTLYVLAKVLGVHVTDFFLNNIE
jgi:transcriptional regulator with XRE-family HTH domain